MCEFCENGKKIKMINVDTHSLSVDTPKDLEYVRDVMATRVKNASSADGAMVNVSSVVEVEHRQAFNAKLVVVPEYVIMIITGIVGVIVAIAGIYVEPLTKVLRSFRRN